jgi:hypothetical protein
LTGCKQRGSDQDHQPGLPHAKYSVQTAGTRGHGLLPCSLAHPVLRAIRWLLLSSHPVGVLTSTGKDKDIDAPNRHSIGEIGAQLLLSWCLQNPFPGANAAPKALQFVVLVRTVQDRANAQERKQSFVRSLQIWFDVGEDGFMVGHGNFPSADIAGRSLLPSYGRAK